MSTKCIVLSALLWIIFTVIANGCAKDIPQVEKGERRLNEYISHYETLKYDHEHLRASHNRAKRSVTKDHDVKLKFSAHGRRFHLRLKRDLSTFSDKLEIQNSKGAPLNVNTDHIYAGHVIGEPESYVFGAIHDGVFEGKIITERDVYYVEHAKHYFPQNRSRKLATSPTALPLHADNSSTTTTTTAQHEKHHQQHKQQHQHHHHDHQQQPEVEEPIDFHSIIYKESHVSDPYENIRDGHVGGCGITDEVSLWMENIQNSAVEELPVPMSKDDHHKRRQASKSAKTTTTTSASPTPQAAAQKQSRAHQTHPPKKYASEDFKYPHQKYTKEANLRHTLEESLARNGGFYDPATGRRITGDEWHELAHERVRRAAAGQGGPGNGLGGGDGSSRREDNKNTCSLYIQTDPLIWNHIREGIADHTSRAYEIDIKTREEITSLIAHHVTAVNYIYRNTKFDGRSEHRNIRFEVQRIKIDDDSACRNAYNGPHNAYCNEHMDVSNFLNLHSLEDHSDFCLAYVFTYRDFTGGTLGLAWVASASGASGGICEKYKTYTETVGGQYQSTKRSLNTGIITFVNYNSRVPPKVSQLTLAHEIGHNFGSPHDFPQECRPGGIGGNFIMFASATSGDRPNNSKFSPCSIRNISNVLDVVVGHQKRDCFKASEGAFCGNKIVEVGEECDCGFNEDECKDHCCYPRLISEYDQSLNSTAKGCTRRAKTQCSPSQGPCCLANSCTFVPQNHRQKCKEETECSWSSTCNGTSAECPEPKPRDDKTRCGNDTALCIRGECSGSMCLLWNMSECFLSGSSQTNADKRKLCELACMAGNDTRSCRSTSEFAHEFGLRPGGISLRPGSPCDNYQGYCDVFLRCRPVDADGPLLRLKNLLLNRETLLTVFEWVTVNWYLAVLLGVGFILIMGVFIKCCAVHTPSSNPKKRRARRISETLRAPMNTLRRMQRHPNQRGGGGAGPRSIPPPAHEQHYRGSASGGVSAAQHHHRGGQSQQQHPGDYERRGGGGGRATRSTGISSSVAGSGAVVSRNSRSNGGGSRPPSGTRASYADQAPAGNAGAAATAAHALNIAPAISSGGIVARAQLPLPMTPSANAQQQQQSGYYAPKDTPRNKSRSSRSKNNNNTSATSSTGHGVIAGNGSGSGSGAKTKDKSGGGGGGSSQQHHTKHAKDKGAKASANKPIPRRNIVY